MWPQFVMIFLFLLLPSLLVLLVSNMIKRSDEINHPPSPPKRPFIGNLHQLGPVPHRSLRALSDKYGPLMLLQLGRIPTLIVSSREVAREVFKSHDLIFASRPTSKMGRVLFYGGAGSNLAPYGERWARTKRLCVTHFLSSKKVRSFRNIREEEAERMVAKIRRTCSRNPSGLVDLTEVLSAYMSDVLGRTVSSDFFREESRQRELREIIKTMDILLKEFHVEDFFPYLRFLGIFDLARRPQKNAKRMDVLLEDALKCHANKSEDADEAQIKPTDLVDVLLSLQKDGGFDDFPLSRESIKTVLVDIFAAGSSSTYSVIEWSMTELLRNPKVMEELQAEVRSVAGDNAMVREEDLGRMSLLKAVVKEVLRLHPSDPLLVPRETMEDCQLAGYKIPKRTRVFINAWAIGRDPKCWEEPDEFRPKRFVGGDPMDFKGSDPQLFPFGGGRRSCPGISFAVQNIELALANLVFQFEWEVPQGMKREDLCMSEVRGAATGGGMDRLELVAKPFSS